MDIQMPELTGLQLSKVVQGRCKVIFTTAYPQFALESYELNVVDYLLKPISFDRFYSAVTKAHTSISDTSATLEEKHAENHIFIKTDGKNNFERVEMREICYIEGLKNYVAVHLRDRRIVTYSTLKYLEDQLPEHFIKIHRSYIVSLKHIQRTDSLNVHVNGKELPIGDTYRKAFFKRIKNKEL